MIFSAKSQFFFKIALSLLLLVMSTSSCSPAKPPFQSDEKIKLAFQNHRSEIINILKKCRAEKGQGGIKPNIQGLSHNLCKASPTQLQKINVLEVSTEVVRGDGKNIPTDLAKNNSFLFVTDQNTEKEWGTYVEEKGYIFSAAPFKNDVITTGSLDQFRNTEIEDKSEKWRYIPIEPNWYLYYRQYRHSYP
jgi:hypothetical protein